MTSCIVTNEIAKTPQKEEEKDDVNPFDEWKSKFFQAIFSNQGLVNFLFFADIGNRSKVTKSDKWIIWKFGEHSKEKYKHWSDIPDYVT